MTKKRPDIPQEIVDKSMVLCKRKCFWCEKEEATEMHHIDENSQNNNENNLCACCSNCHKKFHTIVPFARNITENELKMRRDNFYYQQSHPTISILKETDTFQKIIIKVEPIKNGKR
ncbi:hypothetical protein J4477_00205 [Candidatus Pacearchaeota archaeon]|nr:hypothetical protein [Candidatus Pacearchaeota archaeon]